MSPHLPVLMVDRIFATARFVLIKFSPATTGELETTRYQTYVTMTREKYF